MSSDKVFGEVLAGPERRRRWSDDQKREIVSESLQPGAAALAVARRHGISSGLLYTWRRTFGAGLMPSSSGFVPVAVIGEPPVPEQRRHGTRPEPGGAIGIELPGGIRLHVERGVDAASLRLVLSVLGSVR
jgi:transposase